YAIRLGVPEAEVLVEVGSRVEANCEPLVVTPRRGSGEVLGNALDSRVSTLNAIAYGKLEKHFPE
ncbi:MAG: hypothetical protein ACI8W3_001674, partial [Myxococcota bacterium]